MSQSSGEYRFEEEIRSLWWAINCPGTVVGRLGSGVAVEDFRLPGVRAGLYALCLEDRFEKAIAIAPQWAQPLMAVLALKGPGWESRHCGHTMAELVALAQRGPER